MSPSGVMLTPAEEPYARKKAGRPKGAKGKKIKGPQGGNANKGRCCENKHRQHGVSAPKEKGKPRTGGLFVAVTASTPSIVLELGEMLNAEDNEHRTLNTQGVAGLA